VSDESGVSGVSGVSVVSGVTTALGRAQRRAPVLQLVALAALFVYGFFTVDNFGEGPNIRAMLVLAAILGMASIGQTLVFLLGGLDLSIAGFLSASSIVLSQLCGIDHWPFTAALLVILVAFGALGGVSGWICHRYSIQPLIVTLGMGSIALGASVVLVNGTINGSAPAFLSTLTAADGSTFGLPLPPVVFIWALVAVVLAVLLHRTVAGRQLYATGANPRAAALARVPVRRVWVTVFAASAIFSAVAGVLLAGFSGADQGVGDPFLFQGLTAIIVGGTTVMGARGDYTHTVVGVLILTELNAILTAHNLDSSDQQILYGVLILLIVASYGREPRLSDRV
jgi:ribose transport system permease protein